MTNKQLLLQLRDDIEALMMSEHEYEDDYDPVPEHLVDIRNESLDEVINLLNKKIEEA